MVCGQLFADQARFVCESCPELEFASDRSRSSQFLWGKDDDRARRKRSFGKVDKGNATKRKCANIYFPGCRPCVQRNAG